MNEKKMLLADFRVQVKKLAENFGNRLVLCERVFLRRFK